MNIGEAFRFSVHALSSNKLRSALTALGMVIGNASVILVVTIAMTSRDYVLQQIRGIGSNIVYAYCQNGGPQGAEIDEDFVKLADIDAVREQLSGSIVAATGVMTTFDLMRIAGREENVQVIGSDQDYAPVRNLAVVAGRFLVQGDVLLRGKVALLTEKLAIRLYGDPQSAVGQVMKIHGLQFTVVGVFKERVPSFGLSELSGDTVLIPVTVVRYFTPVERIDPMYVQARSPEDVPAVTDAVRRILESRHNPRARYLVENLTEILDTAKQVSLVLTIVLLLISAIALIISGIGIMNIMLVTVTERTREIGLRMAIGASRADVLRQFVLEAMMLSLSGGALGILVGISIPLAARYFLPGLGIPISPLSVAAGVGVSCLVGLIFGLLPANRAARLNPSEALRYE
ncbi:MAG TPA: ABC transporter permease [Bryobacteraceae bacterium]|nr:ABC transporter permease [Bryobacteraceae bacterium]